MKNNVRFLLLALLLSGTLAQAQTGSVGVGTTTPDPNRPLTIRGRGTAGELLSFQDASGTTRYHWNLRETGLNLAETAVADARLFVQGATGRIGLGSLMPRAGLDVSHPDGIVATGTFNQGSTDNLPTGTGTRLLWVPRKAAFRAGFVEGGRWNIDSVGNYSVGMGDRVLASGSYAVALGRLSTANAFNSTALGNATNASGPISTAMGDRTTASGSASTALGIQTTASGVHSTALGQQTTASGNVSTALGLETTASGYTSTALGLRTTASGESSTALGTYVSTNGFRGSFIIGDLSPSATTASTAQNQFTARFANGYRLFTNTAADVGVRIVAGGNSWETLSDSTRKEHFRPVDGAAFLRKISQMRLGSWNYKGQDPKTFRHYGPMAQDFFAAFGQDEVGTIGEPTTINQADFDGVNLIAIKALIEEVEQLKAENRRLQEQNRTLRADVDWIKNQLNASTGH